MFCAKIGGVGFFREPKIHGENVDVSLSKDNFNVGLRLMFSVVVSKKGLVVRGLMVVLVVVVRLVAVADEKFGSVVAVELVFVVTSTV